MMVTDDSDGNTIKRDLDTNGTDKLTSGDKSLDLSAFKLSRLFFSLLSSGSLVVGDRFQPYNGDNSVCCDYSRNQPRKRKRWNSECGYGQELHEVLVGV
nr:hypothetical protein [Tanacetum cinerariifolium]